jgi:hypothetical protein
MPTLLAGLVNPKIEGDQAWLICLRRSSATSAQRFFASSSLARFHFVGGNEDERFVHDFLRLVGV